MLYVYTTEDGVPYTAEDGTILVVGDSSNGSLNLITDRTATDVESVQILAVAIKSGVATEEQVQQYLNVHQKGAYTHEDLNRVETAVQYVAGELNKYGYMPTLPVTQSWSMTDKPNMKDFERYLNNVARIRRSLTVWASTPVVPTTINGFDYNKANALEQILVDVDQILNYMKDAWFYLGDLYLAEV